MTAYVPSLVIATVDRKAGIAQMDSFQNKLSHCFVVFLHSSLITQDSMLPSMNKNPKSRITDYAD